MRETAQVGYEPRWKWVFLAPKFWGVWLGVLGLIILGLIPYGLRDKFACKIGLIVAKKAHKQRHRANVNLHYCFPNWEESQYDQVIDEMFVITSQVMLGIGEIALRSPKHLRERCELRGFEHLTSAQAKNQNVILFVPHTWAIDTAGLLLRSSNLPLTAMYNPHRNELVNWLWTKLREKFGGKMHARQNGIKPFLSAIRKGEYGFYLPDEDYGAELSVFAKFFATQKATLPSLNKMAKVAKAIVLPTYATYNAQLGKYIIDIRPPLGLFDDDQQMAESMNKCIEELVTPDPAQYVWILRILKTQPDGKDIYEKIC